jgi:hypothetical protein
MKSGMNSARVHEFAQAIWCIRLNLAQMDGDHTKDQRIINGDESINRVIYDLSD